MTNECYTLIWTSFTFLCNIGHTCTVFPKEREGHTNLPQHHQGCDAVIVHVLCQIDEVEGLFCVVDTVLSS